MKKLAYISILIFALVLMNTSCTKTNDGDLPYAVQYPHWKNLTWVSTDGVSNVGIYPRLQISIDANNEIKVVQQLSVVANDTYSGTYTEMTVSDTNSGTVTLDKSNNNAVSVTGTFTINSANTQITLTTNGLSKSSHVYVLKIN
jgi:hypothetical protein